MAVIVCATRGGEGSRAAQLMAIEAARSEGEDLVFLYVVDQALIEEHDERLKGAVYAELHWLARALLHIARQRAERAGLSAEVVVRDGAVKEEIEQFLSESKASRLLLGASRGTSPVFGDDTVEQFAKSIETDTGVPVTVVRPEDFEAQLKKIRY
ncbi:MAG TPA: universal stress protein [Candidatus Binatia bacterium]|jgi:hypothetical protein|nr:universal stress protein [Candidatus Binatia bacterium]